MRLEYFIVEKPDNITDLKTAKEAAELFKKSKKDSDVGIIVNGHYIKIVSSKKNILDVKVNIILNNNVVLKELSESEERDLLNRITDLCREIGIEDRLLIDFLSKIKTSSPEKDKGNISDTENLTKLIDTPSEETKKTKYFVFSITSGLNLFEDLDQAVDLFMNATKKMSLLDAKVIGIMIGEKGLSLAASASGIQDSKANILIKSIACFKRDNLGKDFPVKEIKSIFLKLGLDKEIEAALSLLILETTNAPEEFFDLLNLNL